MNIVPNQKSRFIINQHLPSVMQKLVETAIYFACLSKLEVTCIFYFTLILSTLTYAFLFKKKYLLRLSNVNLNIG